MSLANLIVLILNCITLINVTVLNVLLIRSIKQHRNYSVDDIEELQDDKEDICD